MQGVLRIIQSRTFIVTLLALGFYVAFASVVTYPFIIKPATTLTAPGFGDVAASVGKYEALTFGKQDPLRSPKIYWLSYPDGSKNNVGVDRVSFLSVGYLWIASRIIGAIAAHSLMTYLGYILTAFITFLFVRDVTRSNLAALIAGFIYGFWPHMYTLARADMTYTHMWLYILPLWAFWKLITADFAFSRASVAMLSIVPCLFWTPYFAVHALALGGVFLVISLAFIRPKIGLKKTLLIGVAFVTAWILGLIAYYLIGMSSSASEVPTRTLNEIYQQSADIRMYILPGTFSWGSNGSVFLNSVLPRSKGISLYVGISVIMLAFVAIFYALRSSISKVDHVDERYRAAAYLSLGGVVTCFLFSLPPTVHFGSFAIYTPSVAITHFVPALRAGQRFVMPLMACLAVLAGFGAATILAKFKGVSRYFVAAAIMLIVGLDLWALPPDHVYVVPSFSAVSALGKESIGPVAQYENNTLINQRSPCLVWNDHKMPLVNDCGLGRSEDLGVILNLPLCDQLIAIRGLGTRYLIIKRTDLKVMQCLNSQDSIGRTIATDSRYTTLEYRSLDSDSISRLKQYYGLPN